MPKPTKDSRPSPAEVEKNFRAELEGKLADIRQAQNPTYKGLPPEYHDFLAPGKFQTDAQTNAEIQNLTRSLPMFAVEEAAPQVKAAMKILAEWNRPKGETLSTDEIVAPASQFKPANLKTYGNVGDSYTKMGTYQYADDPFSIAMQSKSAGELFSKRLDKEKFYEAMQLLGHEASHFYQHRYQDTPANSVYGNFDIMNKSKSFMLPQDELNKKVLKEDYAMSGFRQTDEGDFKVTDSGEHVASVFGLMLKNLIKAQDENDYQTSIGLRPH